jgi:ABC-2 type transport system ATP-binding protein
MVRPALRLGGVSHRFGKLEALSRVDLTVEEGDVYGLLGLNGAGKTTAIRLVLGLIRLRSGAIEIFGEAVIRRSPALFRRVGVLFEDFAAPAYLTGREHLSLHARALGLPRRQAARKADEWLERVGLGGRGSTRVRKYSLGMRRRLGIASALVGSPRLVLLDEPTNGLDPRGITDLRELLLELNRKDGVTVLLSSHVLGEVEQLSNRVGILHDGRVLREGEVALLTRGGAHRSRLRVSDAKRAAAVLAALSWCRGVEMLGLLERRAGGILDVVIAEGDVPRLVRALVAAGIDIHEVSPVKESLETVFHRTVGEALVCEEGSA